MRKLSLLALALIPGLGLAACRGGDDSSTGDDMPGQDGSVNTDDVKIQDIQNDAMTSGTPVKIKGVVVTAIDTYGGKTGDFWVQEPEGGEFSGIHVFGAPLEQVGALKIGDVVDISGAEKDEFQYSGFDPGYGITELKPISGGQMTIAPTGANMPLQPHVVDALAIGQMPDYMARDAEWEKWEGVLITVNNVSAANKDSCVGSMCTDDTLHKFGITGDIIVESALSAMPTPAIARGDCLTSVTGVVDYFFDYQILPRTTSEIATGGTSCPVENTMALCTDNLDNDGNGFADCMDFACQAVVSSCSPSTTIADIQQGNATGSVTVEEAYVIARDEIGATSKGLWIADNLTAAPYEGIYVLTGSTVDASLTVGTRISIQGTVTEYDVAGMVGDTLTELKNVTITVLTPASTQPTPVTTAAITALSDIGANGEPYEGVLVQLSTLKVTNNNLGFGKIELTDNNGNKITMDDDAFQPATAPANMTCYATVTGVMSVQLTDNIRTINPRSDADLVTGTGCN